MAESKTLNARIQHKHAIESDWKKAVNFIPLDRELIIYDKDETHNYERFKLGDGITNVNNLEFILDFESHTKTEVPSEVGAHGLRYYNGVLQYNNNGSWVTLSIADLLI